MKKIFVLSTLISLSMICSCQKQDTAAEQRLSQRQAALDAREKALDEREKALIEKERTVTNTRAIRPELQTRRKVADQAQIQAERQRKIQQLPPEFRALIPDASQILADRAERKSRVQDPGGEADANSPSPSPTPQ
jgi:chromosome segregation ATPase